MAIQKWQFQEAKNKFSYLAKQAKTGSPQFITVHGKTTAVVISNEDYRKLTRSKKKLSKYLLAPEISADEA